MIEPIDLPCRHCDALPGEKCTPFAELPAPLWHAIREDDAAAVQAWLERKHGLAFEKVEKMLLGRK